MQLSHEMTYWERIERPQGPTTGSPFGERLCWSVPEARVSGPELELTLAFPGADWIRIGDDGIRRPDQRLTFTSADGAVVLLRYDVAVIRATDAFRRALDAGTATAFADQYMRMSPVFETGDPGLRWLTDSVWLAQGRLAGPGEIEYAVYRVH